MEHEQTGAAGPSGSSFAEPSDAMDLDTYIMSMPPWTMRQRAGVPAAEPTAPVEQSASQAPGRPEPYTAPTTDVLRGAPAHIGNRPPSYPPHPLQHPSVRDTDEFAAFSPAVLLDGAHVERLTVRAASMRGDSHNWEGSCRQDAMTVTRIGPPDAEMLLLAVADGVGSATYSHIGSYRATREAALHLDQEAENIYSALVAQDERELTGVANKAVARAVEKLRAGWELSAQHEGRTYADKDYATTLHVLLVPIDARVRERVLFSVGDGGLFVLREGRWLSGSPVDDGAVLDTRTDALPHAYSSMKATLLRTAPGDVLLLGTDGITNPLTQRDPAFARHLAESWGGPEIPSMSDFLWQAQTRAKSYDDDRTVICVWEKAE